VPVPWLVSLALGPALPPSLSSWPHCSSWCRGQGWRSHRGATPKAPLRPTARRGPLKKRGPEFQSGGLGAAEVVDSDVDMHVRGPVGRRPRRRNVVRNLLEGDGGPPLVGADHNPVDLIGETAVAEERFVEGCEVSGRRAVDREALRASDHRVIVDLHSRCSQASGHKAALTVVGRVAGPGSGTPRSA
jgi:hypothetical protein